METQKNKVIDKVITPQDLLDTFRKFNENRSNETTFLLTEKQYKEYDKIMKKARIK